MICPICNGSTFGTFAGRPLAKCMKCGSLERTRIVYMTLVKLGLPRPNDRILHFAPEKCFIDLFTQSHGEKYEAVDLFPEKYKHSTKIVKRLDICEDLYSLPSNKWDLILHNHVLEHLFCSVKGILRGFERILKPQGTMIFTIPINEQRKTIEDLNPHLAAKERSKKFGQENHVRLFGGDVVDLIRQSLGKDCLIEPISLFTQEELNMLQFFPNKKLSGNSVFVYKKD